jgi:tRNA pseudouridine55 synthase
MEDVLHGLLVLDKPGGMTSRDAVTRAQRWFPRRTRLGHCGTLDPLATGVLVLCVGAATRLTEYVQNMSKTYHAGLLLGVRSDTDDADGTVTPAAVAQPPDRAAVERALDGFVGEIEQVPPAYSAAKVAGQRAYDLAREGHEVSLKARRVRIDRVDVLAYAFPRLGLAVQCGKGTYIRSLARDLGERLGCGAMVETLRRTRVGPFAAEQGLSLETDAEAARRYLLPPSAAVAELPRVALGPAQAERLRQGQPVPAGPAVSEGSVAVFGGAGELVAVARVERGRLKSEKVLGPLSA